MHTSKVFSTLYLVLCLQINLQAQEKLPIKFGKVSIEDFDIKSSLIDSSTNAVVVADVGKSVFIANTTELTFSLVFKEKKRIRIINKNGYDAATITIPLYVYNNKEETLEDLDAYTYNIENGEVVKTKLAKSSVFTEKHNKNWIYKKFTFPALKEGSIIEYSYEVKSDFFFNLQPWVFQGEYPVLWSQYEAAIPEYYKYVTLAQGYHPFLINTEVKTEESFKFSEEITERGKVGSTRITTTGRNVFDIEAKISNYNWVMKDVPALKEEPFTTTINNSIAKIEFQLNQVAFPNSPPRNYLESWEKVARDLMEDEKFGLPINRPNNWLDNDVENIVKTSGSVMEKAYKIYVYVRDNFTSNDNSGIEINTNLKDVMRNKTGSAADINLLLIAMLRSVKIDANPVILSTRKHGVTNPTYPLINRYNYVIVKAVIENADIYLDATIPQLAFGKLPLKVYNGHSREITNNTAFPLFLIADSLKETNMTFVYISNNEKGGIKGNFTHNLGVYESLALRNKMTTTSTADLKQSIQKNFSEEIVIDNVQIDSLTLLNEPVGLKYEISAPTFTDEDIVYFNPMLSEAIKKNPFTAVERYYPVEMPYTIDDMYTLNMEIPKGYRVDELPKSERSNFNENEGMFEYIISADKSYINFRCRLVLNKATYTNEDYETLRDFYTYIVNKEAQQIVFKKIK